MIEIKDFKKTIPSHDYAKIQEYIEQIRINLNIKRNGTNLFFSFTM